MFFFLLAFAIAFSYGFRWQQGGGEWVTVRGFNVIIQFSCTIGPDLHLFLKLMHVYLKVV